MAPFRPVLKWATILESEIHPRYLRKFWGSFLMFSGSWVKRRARKTMLVTLGSFARFPRNAGIPVGARSFACAESNTSLICWRSIRLFLGLLSLIIAPVLLTSQASGPDASTRVKKERNL